MWLTLIMYSINEGVRCHIMQITTNETPFYIRVTIIKNVHSYLQKKPYSNSVIFHPSIYTSYHHTDQECARADSSWLRARSEIHPEQSITVFRHPACVFLVAWSSRYSDNDVNVIVKQQSLSQASAIHLSVLFGVQADGHAALLWLFHKHAGKILKGVVWPFKLVT